VFSIVGLPATAVKESKEPVRAAVKNSGFEFPPGRITVNLAPADLPKDGGTAMMREYYGGLSLSGALRVPSALRLRAEGFGDLAEAALAARKILQRAA
jgi:magnesium chelatase family protein